MKEHMQQEIDVAISYLANGEPLPADLHASLVAQGVDVAGLEELYCS